MNEIRQRRVVYRLPADRQLTDLRNSPDLHLFAEGKNFMSYRLFGAHPIGEFTRFVVWAPNARCVQVIGDFNHWNGTGYEMMRIGTTGIFVLYIEDVRPFDRYKYRIQTSNDDWIDKADPYAFHTEVRPLTASRVTSRSTFEWSDAKWLKTRSLRGTHHIPISIYEVNLHSWRRDEDDRLLTYRQLADRLVPYVVEMGFTHIELMPIMEHPYDGSWGYQITGFYAPTSRYGTPDDFRYLIDSCHRHGIGVLLDWVPAHFCSDSFGLRYFDGGPVYEAADPLYAKNDQWGTGNFDYSKPEVRSFLMSNLIYWIEEFHIDGFRYDAVAYMLYLNFGGKEIRNASGGYENPEAVFFLQSMNDYVKRHYPHVLLIAEESTAWPKVTGKPSDNGLGFDYKWNMGWMNDILEYMSLDPIFRKGFHKALTFTMTYAFSEHFLLPLSHDEVVHGKKSLLEKMPGLYGEKFSNLRLLLAYQFAHPGKKLLFMGGEFGQFIEWNEWQALDWHLLGYESHRSLQHFVSVLNRIYQSEPCLYALDTGFEGYRWIEVDNADESVISFNRIDPAGNRLIAVFNFTPVRRAAHPIGVSDEGAYEVILDSDDRIYGGFREEAHPLYESIEEPCHGFERSIRVDLSGLSALYIKYKGVPNEER